MLADSERRSRRDDFNRRSATSRGVVKLSAANTPLSSRDSDVDSICSTGDHLDDLQRKRNELLSQLKVLTKLLQIEYLELCYQHLKFS